jgi:hypothetical protein
VALEHVATEVKYPCVYRNYGCTVIRSFDSIGGHQEKCRYVPQPCPVNKLNLGTCTWTGIESNMKSHLMMLHRNLLMDYSISDPYHFNSSYRISCVTLATKFCTLLTSHKDVFNSCSEIKNGIFYSVLQYIGPAADAAKYKYKLDFFNTKLAERLSVTLLVRSLDEDLNEIHNSGNCVKLYPDQYNRFANERSELSCSLGIFEVNYNVLGF